MGWKAHRDYRRARSHLLLIVRGAGLANGRPIARSILTNLRASAELSRLVAEARLGNVRG